MGRGSRDLSSRSGASPPGLKPSCDQILEYPHLHRQMRLHAFEGAVQFPEILKPTHVRPLHHAVSVGPFEVRLLGTRQNGAEGLSIRSECIKGTDLSSLANIALQRRLEPCCDGLVPTMVGKQPRNSPQETPGGKSADS